MSVFIGQVKLVSLWRLNDCLLEGTITALSSVKETINYCKEILFISFQPFSSSISSQVFPFQKFRIADYLVVLQTFLFIYENMICLATIYWSPESHNSKNKIIWILWNIDRWHTGRTIAFTCEVKSIRLFAWYGNICYKKSFPPQH